MTKYFTAMLLTITLLMSPYVIGRFQFRNVVMVVQNLQDNEDDASIEATLRVFGFNDLGALDNPNFSDYYYCGLHTLTNY